jgi:hypothetical protein
MFCHAASVRGKFISVNLRSRVWFQRIAVVIDVLVGFQHVKIFASFEAQLWQCLQSSDLFLWLA